jgi:hypothetical protein
MDEAEPGTQTGIQRAAVGHHDQARVFNHPDQHFVHGCPNTRYEGWLSFFARQWLPETVSLPGSSHSWKSSRDFAGCQTTKWAEVVFPEAGIEPDR